MPAQLQQQGLRDLEAVPSADEQDFPRRPDEDGQGGLRGVLQSGWQQVQAWTSDREQYRRAEAGAPGANQRGGAAEPLTCP